MEQPCVTNGGQTVNIERENSISMIPDMSVISKVFNFNIRIETCLVLLITLSEIVASSVILAFAKNEKPSTALRLWIIGYLTGCVGFILIIYLDYRVKQGILDIIVDQNGSEDGSDSAADRFDYFDKFCRLALALECLKWVFACFYFVWFLIGSVWVTKGRSSRLEAPLIFWLSITFLMYRGLGYALQIATVVIQSCCIPCINAFKIRIGGSESQHDSA